MKVEFLPSAVENSRQKGYVRQSHLIVWMDWITRYETPSVEMKSEGREDMDEDGGELIETVEDETVLPNNYGKH